MACNLSEPQQDNMPVKYVRCKDRPDPLLDTDLEFNEQVLRATRCAVLAKMMTNPIPRSLGFDIHPLDIFGVFVRLGDTSIPYKKDSKHDKRVVNNLVEPDANASQKERKGTDRDDVMPIDGHLGKDLEVNKEYQRTLSLRHPYQKSGPTFRLRPQSQRGIALCKKPTLLSTDFQDIKSENLFLQCLPGEQQHKKIEDIKQPVCQESVDYLSPETGEVFIKKNLWHLTYRNEELRNQLKCLTHSTPFFLPILNMRKQEIKQPLPISDNGCRGNIPCIDSLLAAEVTEPVKSSTMRKLKRKLSKQQCGWQEQKVVEEKKRKTDNQDRRSYGRDDGVSQMGLKTEPDPVEDIPVVVQTPYKQYLLSDNDPMWCVPSDQTEDMSIGVQKMKQRWNRI